MRTPPPAGGAAATAQQAQSSSSNASVADNTFYPAGPKTAPPPVPPPDGQGGGVKLQKYIVVDQFGYRPEMAKVAVLANPQIGWNAGDVFEPGPTLEVRRWSDGEAVFQGPVTPWKNGDTDQASGDRGAWFDFSAVEAAGLYYVYDAKSQTRSYPFEIGKDVYRPVLKAALRMFYFNRANFAKQPPFSCVGKKCWSLGVDYMGDGQDREARSVTDRNNPKTARDLSGGWWDAGDTDKYVTFTQDVMHQLLTAYEEHPAPFTDDFNLPESGNGLPDLIDELRVELDWLKKMQPDDLKGGALVKMGNVDYGDPVPDQSRLPRYYYPQPCSAATIVVAGVFAHAALVLNQFPTQKAYAADLAARGARAFDFYVANPKSDACDDDTIKSGDADRSVAEQAQIAVVSAVYLFALTHDAKYDAVVRKDYTLTRPFTDDRWSLYDQSQGDALLYYASLPKADPATKKAILDRKQSQGETDEIYKFRGELDLYRAYMRPDAYHWGSNNVRAAFGNTNWDMIQYGLASAADRASFRERAAGILHSFHGVNPIQLVYLSNMYAYGGDDCVDEMFHSWFRDKDPKWDNARTSEFGPAPGYVTGGPNRSYCDGNESPPHRCRNSRLRKMPPGKAYLDFNTAWEPNAAYDESWALTEPAIYYQASYVRLVSKFVD
jgi:endoglucanase